MPQPSRITELVGIEAEREDRTSFWLLNMVLLLLGAAILAVDFYFLDSQDPRVLYNPWTYAVATPIGLLGLSMLLSTVVSRLVEKSMQLAFLLSVLIHLILLVCAVNVVIFSRMWPDMLDSLAQQQEQLRRESLQAKQYHRLSLTTQKGQRPDYLKHVPTEHQPTHLEVSESPSLAMSRSARDNLVSPSPKIELTHNPALLEREKPATTLPTSSEQIASLSRSDLLQSQPDSFSKIDNSLTELSYENSPFRLQATEAPIARNNPSRNAVLERQELQPAFSPDTPELSQSLPRAATAEPSAAATAAVVPLPRNPLPAADSLRADLTAPVFAPEASLTPAPTQSLASSSAAQAQRRSSRSASESTLPSVNPSSMVPENRPSDPNPRALRQLTIAGQASLPNPGDTAISLPKDSAGGRIGPAAAKSMPVYGVDNLGAPETATEAVLQAASMAETKRRSTSSRSNSALSELGAPQSLSWNGTPSLSNGFQAGRAPAHRAQDTTDGNASSADVAGLIGRGRDLERSSLSWQAEAGLPAAQVDQGIEELANATLEAAGRQQLGNDPDPAQLAAAETRLQRSANASNIGLPTDIVNDGAARGAMLSNALASQSRVDLQRVRNEALPNATAVHNSRENLPKTGELGLEPRQGKSIEIPDAGVAASGGASSGLDLDAAAVGKRRSSEPTAMSTPLDIDQDLGPGGIATDRGSGPLLSRRDWSMLDNSPPQIDSQRFARQDVGGLLAAGQRVAVPRPAFQQRLDRLKDDSSQDEAFLGPQTELAIERGLEFLAKHQRPDGAWRLQDFDTEVLMRSDTAATGLALLAFQGAGYTHRQFKYQETVDRALQFLVAHQLDNGDLYIRQDPASDQNAWLYSHGIAALAMCEAYGMTQDPALRPAAQKAVDFMVASQDPQRGGWRYRPGAGADTSVTGWFMMAFKSGQLAGLDVPQSSFDSIKSYLDASQASANQPYLYRYNPYAANTPQQRHGLEPTSVMTSVGLLMRLYFGWQRDRQEMMMGADYLLEHLPEHGTATRSLRDTYYWYYATQVMFHMRGERWQRWHGQLYPLLINSQITEGDQLGSWDPNYPTPDLWARYGGRLYVTTLNLLSLEVSYRHLPLYEATAQ